jgi:AraC-like DNA-binding protein
MNLRQNLFYIFVGQNIRMALSPTYLYGLAAMAYVTTCLVVAAVRWFHMCKPYDRNPRYYYPGRPFVTSAWLSSLTLLPYVLHPESGDAWYLARFYFLPVTLYHFILLLFSYFGSVMEWKQWTKPTVIAGVPVALGLLTALGLAIWPGEQIESRMEVANFILYFMGLMATAVCISSLAVVIVWANRFDPDDYSNPADFPVKTARRWSFLVILTLLLCWTGALLNNPTVLAVIQLLIAFCCVLFVITALHPNRNRPVEEEKTEAADATTQVYKRVLSKQKQAEILAAIITVVEEQEGYLDPHLTLQDVANRCGYSRTYIAGLVKSELGGFFTYVNQLRLNHADRIKAEHPDISIGELVETSGFGSYATYYKIRRQLQRTDGE